VHVLAVLTGMMTKTFSRVVANLAWKNVRFHEPVRDGDTVYAESTVMEKRESKSRPGQGNRSDPHDRPLTSRPAGLHL